ncbi:diguanylate cyclase [Chloroflexota bacterium]
MNPWAIIPLVSCMAYAILLTLVLLHVRSRVEKAFAVFLFAAGAWSFSSFMLTSNIYTSTQTLNFWNGLVLLGAMWANVGYYYFIRVYTNRRPGIVAYIGYAIAFTLLILTISGNLVKDTHLVDGYLYHDIGPWLYVMMGTLLPLSFITLWILVRRYRRSADPVDRNITLYLLVGWGLMAIWSATNANVPTLALLPTDHLGVLANAAIISIAILKFRLLDIRLVARRGLALTTVFIIIGLTYACFLFLLYQFLSGQQLLITILIVTAFTIPVSLLGRPLRHVLERRIDRMFHRETYIHRQELLDFTNKIGNILNLDEVANELLPTISKALRLTQAKLLLQETDSGDFTTHFAYPPLKEGTSDELRFSLDNPLATWLAKESRALNLEQLASVPQLKGLWAAEKEQLKASGLGLLCPIKSRDKLISILALGGKQAGTLYHPEDIQLVTSMASQASIVIENALLYTQATIRANTDGLTSLYNHRHFHERLEQEIARGSRFGTIFSLIMLDIDLFKTYNDIYGHLAGDQILRKMGEHIKGSIRSLDMAFRYGGEEFTIILPETRLDEAYNVAERIRKRIETRMSSRIVPITISLGMASFPTDGVTKEEIIAGADSALYRAKDAGRNRTSISSDMVNPETPAASTEETIQRGTLNIIYALAATVDAKDHYTYGHSKKVSEYAVAIAEALGLPQDRISTVRAGALLHDIGKIGVPDSILNKQGSLTEMEWEPIKEHPQLGVEILRHVIDLVNCLPVILHHHERYDGNGYPYGLKGNNIPLEARILAIADSYDAITSLRPYRQRQSPQEALAELNRCAGTQFDPKLVGTFRQVMESVLSKEIDIKQEV